VNGREEGFRGRRQPVLVLLLAIVTIAVGGSAVLTYVTKHQKLHNDQATLDRLRSQFARSPWEPSLISAYSRSPEALYVGLSSDDRQLALAACADLIAIVKTQTSTGPGGVTYTITHTDASLFILDRSNNILVTNFLSLDTGCRWRLN
jgi:hypothetical protein